MSAIGTLTTHHVGLNVTDLERSLAFYADVLGFEVLGRSAEGEAGAREEHAFLGRDGSLVLTLWQQAEGAYDSGRPGLHHLAFEAESSTMSAPPRPRSPRAAPPSRTRASSPTGGRGLRRHLLPRPRRHPPGDLGPEGRRDGPGPSGTAPTCGFF